MVTTSGGGGGIVTTGGGGGGMVTTGGGGGGMVTTGGGGGGKVTANAATSKLGAPTLNPLKGAHGLFRASDFDSDVGASFFLLVEGGFTIAFVRELGSDSLAPAPDLVFTM